MKKENQIFKQRHLANLAKLFDLTDVATLNLYKSLRRIECKLNRLYAVACEREWTAEEDKTVDRLQERAKKLLNNIDGLKFNADPRGYSIKMDDEKRRKLFEEKGINLYQDWGGYGIFAPDFN